MIGEERTLTSQSRLAACEFDSSRGGFSSVACLHPLYRKCQTYGNLWWGKKIRRRGAFLKDQFPEGYHRSFFCVRTHFSQSLSENPLVDTGFGEEPFLRGVFSAARRVLRSESPKKLPKGVVKRVLGSFTPLHDHLFLSPLDIVSIKKTPPRCTESHDAP